MPFLEPLNRDTAKGPYSMCEGPPPTFDSCHGCRDEPHAPPVTQEQVYEASQSSIKGSIRIPYSVSIRITEKTVQGIHKGFHKGFHKDSIRGFHKDSIKDSIRNPERVPEGFFLPQVL